MKTYIGTKVVKAIPMNRQAYNDYRGWKLPSNEDGTDEGMLVEYIDGGKPNHPDHEGYISWSPIDVFNNAYKETEGMSFGMAIKTMKLGLKVTRKDWGTPAEVLKLVEGYSDGSKIRFLPATLILTTGLEEKIYPPCQADVLAEDWVLVN